MTDAPATSPKAIPAVEIMTSPVIACHGDAYFEEVADLLAEHRISGVPVVEDGGAIIGVISERDLAHALGGPLVRLCIGRPSHRKLSEDALERIPREARRARDIMSSDPIVARPETPLSALAEIMYKEQINRIPILANGQIVGIVTRGDVLAAIAGLNHHLRTEERPPRIVGSAFRAGTPT